MGVMMTLMIISTMITYMKMSPTKTSFSVIVSSLIISMFMFNISSSVFPSAGIVISFSSGMMILFCYCSMLTNHEKKTYETKSKMNYMVMVMIMLSLSTSESFVTNSEKSNTYMSTSTLMVGAMGVVIITMICINKTMFTPLKSMNQSY